MHEYRGMMIALLVGYRVGRWNSEPDLLTPYYISRVPIAEN